MAKTRRVLLSCWKRVIPLLAAVALTSSGCKNPEGSAPASNPAPAAAPAAAPAPAAT
ncbi:thioredoxin, partial [Myxococcus sp. CA039A]|nr:thioredoxin [Myxococcus sp. CA039A]